MRIIAGVHRSRQLKTLEGKNTRPMMDRMKEIINDVDGIVTNYPDKLIEVINENVK